MTPIVLTGLLLFILIGAIQFPYTLNLNNITEDTQNDMYPRNTKSQTPIQETYSVMSQPSPPTLPQKGFQRNFWILDLYEFVSGITPIMRYRSAQSTLLAAGEYGAIFFTNACIDILGESHAIRFAEEICDAFDTTIYPRITDLAGHPNGTMGDIDGDPRIYILVSLQYYNYYTPDNNRPFSLSNPYSNECEMFYIYYQTIWAPTIAHEFHHLIWGNTESDEPQFTQEGLACYAEYYSGYLTPWDNLEPRTPLFLNHPEDSLLYWNSFNEDELSVNIDYAGSYLLAFYLAEQYGVDILRDMINESTDGAPGIEAVLQTAGNYISFNELYLDWITALTLDEIGFAHNRYGFTEIDARITKTTQATLPYYHDSINLHYYGFDIHRISSPSDACAIQIQKPRDNTVGLVVAFHDTLGWHVFQTILPEGSISFAYLPIGTQIDEVYIITSYLSPTTPIDDGVGHGPTIPIELTITSTLPPIIFPIASLLVLIVISISIIIYSVKTKPVPRTHP
jgi:hypothetical protein